MRTDPIYIPVFRLRQEEQKVLTSFNFGNGIFPCVEIVKEHDRLPAKPRTKRNKNGTLPKTPRTKTFEEIHLPIIAAIKSPKVFVDLPVHLPVKTAMKPEVLQFMTRVINQRLVRTQYIKKLSVLSEKIIPVISTYFPKTNEMNSLIHQEADLRETFHSVAFRTCLTTFRNDMVQITKIAKAQDFLFIDLDDCVADEGEPEIEELIENVKDFVTCPIVIIRSAVDKTLTNIGLKHTEVIERADNRLLSAFKRLGGHSFGDYVGIKKDDILKGAGRSPGFVFYDPIDNEFYGYRGSDQRSLDDFLNIIIPDVMKSPIIERMNQSGRPYLSSSNRGWSILQDMIAGTEPSRSQAKFKRISMEHYLHCLRTKIDFCDLD